MQNRCGSGCVCFLFLRLRGETFALYFGETARAALNISKHAKQAALRFFIYLFIFKCIHFKWALHGFRCPSGFAWRAVSSCRAAGLPAGLARRAASSSACQRLQLHQQPAGGCYSPAARGTTAAPLRVRPNTARNSSQRPPENTGRLLNSNKKATQMSWCDKEWLII